MKNSSQTSEEFGLPQSKLLSRIENAREISHQKFGRKITFYLPGMFSLLGKKGKYPAISVTGNHCELMCKHCKGKLLNTMISANNPEKLIAIAEKLKGEGVEGVLLSGGSSKSGVVPLEKILSAVPRLKEMGLYVSAHTGFVSDKLAEKIAGSGIDQVLVDVVGDDEAAKDVLNLEGGTKVVAETLEALFKQNLSVVPHIIIGLGKTIKGEYYSLRLISQYSVKLVSFVVLMPAVAMGNRRKPVPIWSVIDIIVSGRELMPNVEQALGCARPRGKYRWLLEEWAIKSGINRIALWSENAVDTAKKLGLEIQYRYTCCSVG